MPGLAERQQAISVLLTWRLEQLAIISTSIALGKGQESIVNQHRCCEQLASALGWARLSRRSCEISECLNTLHGENRDGAVNVISSLTLHCENLHTSSQGMTFYNIVTKQDKVLFSHTMCRLQTLSQLLRSLAFCVFVEKLFVCHTGVSPDTDEKRTYIWCAHISW